MNITEVCIRRPVFAWMLMAATIVFGGVALSRIGISQFPDVDFPTISVAVTWEGAAPEVMEHDVVEVIEEAVTQVEGVKSITSSSRQGGASITIELDLSRNVDLALQDVQTRVSQAQQRLPKDVDPPVISKSNPEDQPILWIGISGPYSQQAIADAARYRVKEKFQTIPGVGECTMGGCAVGWWNLDGDPGNGCEYRCDFLLKSAVRDRLLAARRGLPGRLSAFRFRWSVSSSRPAGRSGPAGFPRALRRGDCGRPCTTPD